MAMYGECCIVDVDDPAEVYSVTERTAAKEHECCECGDPIQKGERYQYVTGLWDGDWSTFKTCMPCVGIWRDFFRGGVMHGGLHEMFYDCHGWNYGMVPDWAEDDDA